MELMSSTHEFMNQIRKYNEELQGNAGQDITYELVQESYASPAVKRGIWQTLLIIKEIRKIAGKSPDRIFVEVAREKQKNPQKNIYKELMYKMTPY